MEEVMEGQTGRRWDRVVEILGKEMGENRDEILSVEQGAGGGKRKYGQLPYPTLSHHDRNEGKEALKRKVDNEEHLKIYWGL